MTGFSRAIGHDDDCRWAWELKSVNARGLDVRLRTPSGFNAVERAVRDALAKRFKRGAFNAALTITRLDGQSETRINHALLDQLVALSKEYGGGTPEMGSLLGVRGVIEQVEHEDDEAALKARGEKFLSSFSEALDSLTTMRAGEGGHLETVLQERLSEIEALVGEAEKTAAARPDAIKARVREQVASILEVAPDEFDEQLERRLAQELAVLATKADICEELDRLKAHVAAARGLLSENEATGRKLDFLCQEFNRESNTLCAKSGDADLTRIGLAMKATVEQFREQVQNVE
ncbi:MAG: hypothetical protein ACJAU6_000528 [Alphaproteobacteria bacterium]|jgi:uncharacterized protein (TIGR00255 family)